MKMKKKPQGKPQQVDRIYAHIAFAIVYDCCNNGNRRV